MTGMNETPNSTNDDRAVRAVIRAVYAAWADNDADAFIAQYTDDATVVMPGVYRRSRDEVYAYMAAAFAGPLKGSRAIDEPQNVRLLGEDAAVVISEGGILMAGESVLPAERRVRATWVVEKRGGQWLVAAYHNCPGN
jgi:uncharacterized protein (TIGR02246 family)